MERAAVLEAKKGFSERVTTLACAGEKKRQGGKGQGSVVICSVTNASRFGIKTTGPVFIGQGRVVSGGRSEACFSEGGVVTTGEGEGAKATAKVREDLLSAAVFGEALQWRRPLAPPAQHCCYIPSKGTLERGSLVVQFFFRDNRRPRPTLASYMLPHPSHTQTLQRHQPENGGNLG